VTVSASGWVRRVIFNKDDFYILELYEEATQKALVVRGPLYGLIQVKPNVPITLTGTMRKHPKFGPQLALQTWEPWPRDEEAVEVFLHTCVAGFADRELARQIASLGDEAFQKLAEGSEAVMGALPLGTDAEALQEAILGWERAVAVRDLSGLLRTGGLGAGDIQAAMNRFGMDAASVVREDPYRLMEALRDFRKVDLLGMKLGVKANDPRRAAGGILWALREGASQGHLFFRRSQIPSMAEGLFHRHSLLPLSDKEFTNALRLLAERKALVLESGTGVYLPDFFAFERDSANLLANLLAPADMDVDLQPFLESYEKLNRITLSDDQRRAVEQLAANRVLVLTGLPGTGKTTAVRVLVRLFEEAKVSFALMAPTGIAAKRLSAVTGQGASTIHRALRYDGKEWGLNARNRYVVDAVIVDEVSMVDQELLFRLLSALRPDTILVLVGDDAQLPSVGPGNVLRELVDCDSIPNVRLTQIFRQSVKGEIVLNSHRINRGEIPTLDTNDKDTEFRFIRLSDEDRIVNLVVEMAAKLKARNANFQILSPKYKGDVGVDNLNERLRDRLNPAGPKEWKRGAQHFRLGDRLMVIKNDYELGVYNGDMGKLTRIGRDYLVVRIHGIGENDPDTVVEFSFEAAQEKLCLAYAVSVHKSQGSEFDTIILPVVRSQGQMLQRNLLYTAVTRARRKVWVIGEEDAVERAVRNNKVITRNTSLSKAVTESLAAGVEKGHGQEGTAEGSDPQAEGSAGEA